jgi:YD repeat-containing protein
VTVSNNTIIGSGGLMIRPSLAAGSPMISIYRWATSLVLASRRTTQGGAITYNGNSYTGTWVRIQRTGDVFDSAYSANGVTWTTIDSRTLTLASTLYVGMAVCSRQANQLTTATFSNLAVSGTLTGAVSFGYDPAGNRTQVTHADGTTDHYTWDARGHLVAADAGGNLVTLTYNALGQRVSKETSAGTTFFRYDGNNGSFQHVSAWRCRWRRR